MGRLGRFALGTLLLSRGDKVLTLRAGAGGHLVVFESVLGTADGRRVRAADLSREHVTVSQDEEKLCELSGKLVGGSPVRNLEKEHDL